MCVGLLAVVKRGDMEVTYHNSREDIQALMAFARPRMKRAALELVAGAGFAIAPTLLLLIVLGHWLIMLVVLTAMGVLGLFMLWSLSVQLRRQFDQMPIPPGQQTLHLEEDCLEVRGELGRSRRRWRGFSDVRETNEHWMLFLNSNSAHVIPKRAFDAPAAEQDFIARLRHSVDQADAKPVPDLLAQAQQDGFLPPAEEMTWRLQFPGPVDLWQRVSQMGEDLQAKVNLPTRKALLAEGIMPMVMGCGVVALRMSAEHYERSLSPLYFALLAITCLVLTVFSARVVQWYRQRAERPSYEREFGGETRVELSPVGVSIVTRQWVDFHQWERFQTPVLLEDALVLRVHEGQILAILPMTAFTSTEKYQECLLDILRWQSTEETDFRDEATSDLPEVRETGNPFQSPSTE